MSAADEQTQMLWRLISEISDTHQIQLLIDMFGETEVAAVFKEDYDAWKEEEEEDKTDTEDSSTDEED